MSSKSVFVTVTVPLQVIVRDVPRTSDDIDEREIRVLPADVKLTHVWFALIVTFDGKLTIFKVPLKVFAPVIAHVPLAFKVPHVKPPPANVFVVELFVIEIVEDAAERVNPVEEAQLKDEPDPPLPGIVHVVVPSVREAVAVPDLKNCHPFTAKEFVSRLPAVNVIIRFVLPVAGAS